MAKKRRNKDTKNVLCRLARNILWALMQYKHWQFLGCNILMKPSYLWFNYSIYRCRNSILSICVIMVWIIYHTKNRRILLYIQGASKKMLHSDFSLKSVPGIGSYFFRGVLESEFHARTILAPELYPLSIWSVLKTQKTHAQNEGTLLRLFWFQEVCPLNPSQGSECAGCPGGLYWELKLDNRYSAD